jgi:hypothetical protein
LAGQVKKLAGQVKKGWLSKERLEFDTEVAVYRGLIKGEERRLAR